MNLDLNFARTCLSLDSSNLSSNPNVFLEANAFQTAVFTFLWTRLADDISVKCSYLLKRSLVESGLSATIAQCSEYADQRVVRVSDDAAVATWLTHLSTDFEKCDKTQLLQFLRFGKRFTFIGADKLEDKSIRKFIDVNNRCKLLQRSELPSWLIRDLRTIIAKICKGFKVKPADRRFSSGSCCDARAILAEKLHAYAKEECYLGDFMYPLSNSCAVKHRFDTFGWYVPLRGGSYPQPWYTSEVLAVPKNYKTHRIIARESAYRCYQLQAIREALEECIKRNGFDKEIDIHDQSTNQSLGRYGVVMGNFATVDLSSASDSIRYDLIMDVFPAEVTKAVRMYDSTQFSVKTKTFTKYMWATSGSPITFVMESILFYALMREATELYCRFAGLKKAQCERMLGCSYGDDIVVHSDVYPTLVDLLTRCGFIVNTDKSFCEERYRETCGGEWYDDGKECTSIYWPRKALYPPRATALFDVNNDNKLTTLSSLSSLQHRAYTLWDDTTPYQFGDIVRGYAMQCNPPVQLYRVCPGVDSLDVWDAVPDHDGSGKAPQGEIAKGEFPIHILRTSERWKRDPKDPIVEMYLYYQFLQQGPKYATPLDRLLGVSDSYKASLDALYGPAPAASKAEKPCALRVKRSKWC